MLRRHQIYAGICAFAGVVLAATAAVAIDRTQDEPNFATLATMEQAPGIDFTITGPVGPTRKQDVRVEAAAKVEADQPMRRRMHRN
jgi:hypothetical protein